MTLVNLSNVTYAPDAHGHLFSLFSFLKENEAKANFESQGMTLFNANQQEIGYAPEMNGLYHPVVENRDFISDKMVFTTVDVKDSCHADKVFKWLCHVDTSVSTFCPFGAVGPALQYGTPVTIQYMKNSIIRTSEL
jgi:hypothetical protein